MSNNIIEIDDDEEVPIEFVKATPRKIVWLNYFVPGTMYQQFYRFFCIDVSEEMLGELRPTANTGVKLSSFSVW